MSSSTISIREGAINDKAREAPVEKVHFVTRELALRERELTMRREEIDEKLRAQEADEMFQKQEIGIQREQLRLQTDKDAQENERQNTIAGKVEWYGSTLKKKNFQYVSH